ncbi:MAG: hypothetical protein ACTSQJ_00460 [Promethearchaeota archaeon]
MEEVFYRLWEYFSKSGLSNLEFRKRISNIYLDILNEEKPSIDETIEIMQDIIEITRKLDNINNFKDIRSYFNEIEKKTSEKVITIFEKILNRLKNIVDAGELKLFKE